MQLAEWSQCSFKGYISVESGYPFKSEHFVQEGVPVVKIGNIDNYRTIETNADSHIPEDKLREYGDFILSKGDVLIAMSGNTTCKMGRVTDDFDPSLVNQRVGWIKSISDEVSIEFIYHLLISEKYQKRLWAQATATGQPNLSPRDIKRLSYNKPPLPEQRAIAGILSKVDEAIEAVENTIKAAERLKKSLMQNLLSGKLKPDGSWRSEDEFYIDEKFGKVPKGWRCGVLGDIAEITAGQSPSGEHYNDNGDGTPMLNGPTEFKEHHPVPVQWTRKITKICAIGDILFTVRGSSTGRMNFADQQYCIGRGIAAIRNKEESDTDFIYYTLVRISEIILAEAKGAGTTFPNVSRSELLKKKVIIPEIEQGDIARLIRAAEEMSKSKYEKTITLRTLKKSLMQHLLTGKVRVDVEKINRILEEAE